jgi:DNA-binding LacI/PurR family transcriptional regulator
MAKGKITIRDIASLCHVSTATVSRALNGKPGVGADIKKAVLRCAEEYGYTFDKAARSMRIHDEDFICVVQRPNMTGISYAPALDPQKIKSDTGLSIRILEVPFRNDLASALLRYETLHHPQLFIVPGPCGSCADTGLSRVRAKILFVVSDDAPEEFPSVMSDDYHGSRVVTDSLIESGHTSIGVLTERSSTGELRYMTRIQGYRDSLNAHGITYDPHGIYSISPDYDDYFSSTGEQIRKRIVPLFNKSNGGPETAGITALFVLSDFLALGVMRELWNVGIRVPDDLSLASFGGWDYLSIIPGTTRSWVQPLNSIAQTMFAAAMFTIHDEPFRNVPLHDPQSQRKSTATAISPDRLVVPGYLRYGESVRMATEAAIRLTREQSAYTALKRGGNGASRTEKRP